MQPLIKDLPVEKAYGFALINYADVVKQFFENVIAGVNSEDCWGWKSHKVHGYPVLRFNGRLVKGSRLSWELHSGLPMRDGTIMFHSCNNPACCNPRHVSPQTHQRNMDYMIECGREYHPSGDALSTKMNSSSVVSLRNDYASGNYSFRTLGNKYGISKTHARYIVQWVKWKSIPQ